MQGPLFSLLLGLLLCATNCTGGSVVTDLTSMNFDGVLDGSYNVLVLFYAPWCGHCKALSTEYEKLATHFDEPDRDGVIIARMDATVEVEISRLYEISGYPTLLWFPKKHGNDEHGARHGHDSLNTFQSSMGDADRPSRTPRPWEAFTGGQTIESMAEWVRAATGGMGRKYYAPLPKASELETATFDAVAYDPSMAVLVEFFAPWCAHCKSFAPTYESLAKVFEAEERVVVATVDATQHRSLAERFDVSGYPTVKFFPRADGPVEQYNGPLELEELIAYLNAKAGTFRTRSGGLAPAAGTLTALTRLVRRVSASVGERVENSGGGRSDGEVEEAKGGPCFDEATMKEAEEVVAGLSGDDEEDKENGALYLKAMRKCQQRGLSYVTSEIRRLQDLIDSPDVSPFKKNLFMKRKNILSTFGVGSSELGHREASEDQKKSPGGSSAM